MCVAKWIYIVKIQLHVHNNLLKGHQSWMKGFFCNTYFSRATPMSNVIIRPESTWKTQSILTLTASHNSFNLCHRSIFFSFIFLYHNFSMKGEIYQFPRVANCVLTCFFFLILQQTLTVTNLFRFSYFFPAKYCSLYRESNYYFFLFFLCSLVMSCLSFL